MRYYISYEFLGIEITKDLTNLLAFSCELERVMLDNRILDHTIKFWTEKSN